MESLLAQRGAVYTVDLGRLKALASQGNTANGTVLLP